MDLIKMLRKDYNLLALLSTVCDVEILPEFRASENEFGYLTYNIPGKAFAEAGSGSEYILLEDGIDLPEAQQKLADILKIEKKTDVVDILMRFYSCTKREPRFIQTYTESDGSVHSGTGSLFDR